MSSQHRESHLYLWIWGAMLVVLGVGSLIVNPDFATGDRVTEKHLFGLFETNGWHGLAGAFAGTVALASAWSHRWIQQIALSVAVIGGLIPALVFLLSGDDSVALGLIPVDAADALSLHLLPGLVGVACVVAGELRSHPPGRSAQLSG